MSRPRFVWYDDCDRDQSRWFPGLPVPGLHASRGCRCQERSIMGIEVKIEGESRLDPEFDALLKQAQSTLESIVSRSSISTDAIWLVHKDDKGQDRVALVLADTVENLRVSTDFSLDDFKD